MKSGILIALALIAWPVLAAVSHPDIDDFNRRFRDATLRMDNAAIVGLWDEEGVTLLPNMAPVEGKAAIATWLNGVVAGLSGYHVTAQENEFHDIQVSGDWASEWGTTHQVVQAPEGRPPIEAWGKILLVLHRDATGAWKIREEMWCAGKR